MSSFNRRKPPPISTTSTTTDNIKLRTSANDLDDILAVSPVNSTSESPTATAASNNNSGIGILASWSGDGESSIEEDEEEINNKNYDGNSMNNSRINATAAGVSVSSLSNNNNWETRNEFERMITESKIDGNAINHRYYKKSINDNNNSSKISSTITTNRGNNVDAFSSSSDEDDLEVNTNNLAVRGKKDDTKISCKISQRLDSKINRRLDNISKEQKLRKKEGTSEKIGYVNYVNSDKKKSLKDLNIAGKGVSIGGIDSISVSNITKVNRAESEFDKALTDVVLHKSSHYGHSNNITASDRTNSSETNISISKSNAATAFRNDDNNKGSINDDDGDVYLYKAESAVLEEVLSSEQDQSPKSSSFSLQHQHHHHNDRGASFDEMQQKRYQQQMQQQHQQGHLPFDSMSTQKISKSHEEPLEKTTIAPSATTAASTINASSRELGSLPSKSSVRTIRPKPEDLSSGVLPDVLMTMRQKIESLTLFDSDMLKLTDNDNDYDGFEDEDERASKESLRRSFQQSISAAVLVSLAHKRYERRRLAAMEIEKVVRSLAQQTDLERVRAILLLLSDDYVRSTNEDARKGGVVALAACSIGLKKANDANPDVIECKDLILASVVHACQDHSQRVRYYATESLFNVIKVIPALAIQHFFILFEILRALYSDVDLDVRSGAQLLDKKLKEVIVAAINNGSFTADQCVPLFARYVHVRNKPPSKFIVLTWLQEFSVQLVGSPMLEFLHLFLGGIFAMLADPTASIIQLALSVLETVLPQLLVTNDDFEDGGASMSVDFDKILQSLVTTMEHPNPFVRKVAMYWMSRIVQAHMSDTIPSTEKHQQNPQEKQPAKKSHHQPTVSVRNSLPHVLPGILLSIGDNFRRSSSNNDTFLPEQTTHALAEQTNTCLQSAVRRDGTAYVSHLDGFIVALREELDSRGLRNPPTKERKPYRMDVKSDGTGIERSGWFRSSDPKSDNDREDSVMMSRLCALQWITVLYESVVPDSLKAEYAREFISPIIQQLVDNPPELIIFKSLEVLAKITVPVESERNHLPSRSSTDTNSTATTSSQQPLTNESVLIDASADYALTILNDNKQYFKSRDREVFAALIHLHSHHHRLLADFSRVIEFMCTLQPPEFVFVSFSIELDNFVTNRQKERMNTGNKEDHEACKRDQTNFARDLEFASCFIHQMNHVLLTSPETLHLREVLQDCIGGSNGKKLDERSARLFHILLFSFAHNFVAALSLCFWGSAFLTASMFLHNIDPLDINIMFYLEMDQLIELLERPIFRHLHLRLLQQDIVSSNAKSKEGCSVMLFRVLKSMLMVLPLSTSYKILRKRLLTVAKFRSATSHPLSSITLDSSSVKTNNTELFVSRLQSVRNMHCAARWRKIRSESLEPYCFHGPEYEDCNYSSEHQNGQSSNVDHSNSSTIKDSNASKHQNEVLLMDQVDDDDIQALTRHGLAHQSLNGNNDSDKNPTGGLLLGGTRGSNMRTNLHDGSDASAERGKGKWMEYWTQAEDTNIS